jgi:hypothetical protein
MRIPTQSAFHQHESSAQFLLIERGTAGFAAFGGRAAVHAVASALGDEAACKWRGIAIMPEQPPLLSARKGHMASAFKT